MCANVVGYQEIATKNGGHVMLAPTFFTVGGEDGCTLADLKVTGYDPLVEVIKGIYYTGGCKAGQFVLRRMKLDGSYEASYYWIDDGMTGPAGWYADGLGTPISGGAASIKFAAGEGAWTLGSGYSLLPAGQVNFDEFKAKTLAGGHVVVGNGRPVPLTLADLTVTDYPPLQEIIKGVYYNGGCKAGQFVLRRMKLDGSYEASYYWIDDGMTGPAGWYADGLGTPIPEGPASVKFAAGDGAWVLGTGYSLIIPGIEIEK